MLNDNFDLMPLFPFFFLKMNGCKDTSPNVLSKVEKSRYIKLK